MTQRSLENENNRIFQQTVEREWLICNGIGGFACGTASETNTRRYHGLLMTSLAPPARRTLLVAKLDISVRYLGQDYSLFSNEFADGTIAPQGFIHLQSFRIEQGLPVWLYAVADALIEKRIVMQTGCNTTLVHLKILRASDSLAFTLTPLCTYRDYHSLSHYETDWAVHLNERGNSFTINTYSGAYPYHIRCAGATFTANPDWYWQFKYRMETTRGLDDTEDLFCPGYFNLTLRENQQTTVILTSEISVPADFDSVQKQIYRAQQKQLQQLPDCTPDWIQQLVLASRQFIVERHQQGLPAGKTIIAGYPWFTDWGRDTMIALPGLTLSLGHFDIAASILYTFAEHVSKGMLPNRFPDQDTTPDYNSVDATLWFIHAIDQYTYYSGDNSLIEKLYPLLNDIIHWHRKGTRFNIRIDTQDGLLMAGEPGVQLTWMDAKVGDWVVTPRIGKCVEINALWYNALMIMSSLAGQLGDATQNQKYQTSATQVKNSFQRFWNKDNKCLFDVIDSCEGDVHENNTRHDGSLRPNQIFAVSLPHSPLSQQQQKSVLDCCRQHLLTPFGLRSLAVNEPDYIACYQGNPTQRDAAYHQGTVWAWLIGPFIDAHYRVYQDSEKALSFLQAIALHLDKACLGQVSEIFDADPPFHARGCFAQAWSVGEILRVWIKLNSTSSG